MGQQPGIPGVGLVEIAGGAGVVGQGQLQFALERVLRQPRLQHGTGVGRPAERSIGRGQLIEGVGQRARLHLEQMLIDSGDFGVALRVEVGASQSLPGR